jgi:class 3 adenylate cyclase/tetratricopeptide (TPR) repeat protein
MFCDMVGSSALSTRLDPEEQREIIAAFQTCCATEVTFLGGMVAQYLGDGVLAYFGFPTAHENDAERAILAGLAILKAITSLKPAGGIALQTRIAIGSGVVVVGDLVGQRVTQENAAIGETTNLVARLQTIAEPNSIVISPVTHRLVGALFDYRDLGRHALKGFPEPVHVRQVLGVSKVESRFEAQHQSGTSPLFGREEELELLLRRWEQAKGGEGRVVLLTGEPGIGKSRIARALRDRLISDPHTSLSYFCSPHHQDSALYPNIGQLSRAAGIERDDSAETKLHKLQSLLAQSSGNLAEDMPLFAALLSISRGHRYPLPEISPQRRKERTLAALLDYMNRLATRQPILMLFEDLHWIDRTSLELLSLAIERIKDQRILLLATARPEFTPPWPDHRHISTLSLNRLGRSEGEALILGITKGKLLPPEVLAQIMARTDGVPLFIEELTKTVLESGLLHEADSRYELAGPLPSLAIPSTLHASLLARLDRLGSAKDVAQIGAAIGRGFSYSLVAVVAALPEKDLKAALAQLVDAGLIYQRGVPPDATYQFKHALVQDVSYASLVRVRRQQLHRTIARVLQDRFPEVATTEPERLAHHYTEAGLAAPAVIHWRNAGALAVSRSAVFEAVAHLKHGLEVLATQPDERARKQTELELRMTLASALIGTKSWAALEVLAEYKRANELAKQIGDQGNLIRTTFGMWMYPAIRENQSLAVDVAQDFLKLAETSGDIAGRWIGHCCLAFSSLQVGAFCAAREHSQKAMVLDDLERASAVCQFTALDLGVQALANHDRALAILGFPHQARLRRDELLVRGRTLGHTLSTVYSLSHAAVTSWLVSDETGFTTAAETFLSIVAEEKFPPWVGPSKIYAGWLRIEAGSPDEGCRLIQEGLAHQEAIGVIMNQYSFMLFLAAGQLRSGQIDAGIDTLDRAASLIGRTGSRWCEAEVYRLRGDLLVARSAKSNAERSYRNALEIARLQQAKLWEIRAAISLGRLWRDQGRRHEAFELLAPIYSWFTEGFDTGDLKDAKVLLTQLNA